MKIRSILFTILVCISFSLSAQTNLQVQGISPNLYLVHTVVSKDNWYSIGRLYNLNPKELAPFNDLPLEKPLEIGQEIRIPLKPTNFSQDNQKADDEVFVPVYYVVKEREWMYRISQNNNKVPIERLEQWNNAGNNDIRPGQQMIIGFLKVKSSQSPLASQATSVRTAPPVAKVNEQSQKTADVIVPTKTEDKALDQSTSKSHEVAVKETPKLEEKPLEKTDTHTTDKIDPRVAENKSAGTKTDAKSVSTQIPVDNKGGFFKMQYDETGKATSGAAGVFRSTSGWQDGKYYALMNNIPVGTIIKVANPSNGRTVYAKVLGNLPDMKESAGLTLRLSDAAATELGLASNKFPVSVRY
jgi:LysM repeat protein